MTRNCTLGVAEGEAGPSAGTIEYYIKWTGRSYRQCSWVSLARLEAAAAEDMSVKGKLRNFQRSASARAAEAAEVR